MDPKTKALLEPSCKEMTERAKRAVKTQMDFEITKLFYMAGAAAGMKLEREECAKILEAERGSLNSGTCLRIARLVRARGED